MPAAERYASLFQGGFKGGAGGRNSAWLRDTADTPQGKRRYAVSVSHADTDGRFGDVRIYALNLGFLVYALGAYVLMNSPRFGERLGPARVAVFVVGYLIYLALTVWLLALN